MTAIGLAMEVTAGQRDIRPGEDLLAMEVTMGQQNIRPGKDISAMEVTAAKLKR
jgi:hypothetical protein